MKVTNIILIFVGLIFGIIVFGVVCPYLISAYDTISVLIGIGLFTVVIFGIVLIGNSILTKYLKKDVKTNEEK